ncbi:hypothetical protein B0T20DRAFT_507250 [Sordaria brevicollis]|uniref:Uncharacterized protein n=1 Tax=Sordaria brevicollis TaxID=83679 RepID=A0AAE0PF76_SORBR|nr:hypothetical protein B0T20DRAFT_507250 [Sordaria brevicollis]
MPFTKSVPRLRAPLWLPSYSQLIPWLYGVFPILVCLVDIGLHLFVHFSAVNRRVDDWPGWWVITEPAGAHMIIAGFLGPFMDVGYRQGGASNFFRRRQDRVPMTESSSEYGCTTGILSALMSFVRLKHILTALSSMTFTIGLGTEAFLWAHVLQRTNVTNNFEGTTQVHFTPEVLSYRPALQEFTQPIAKDKRQMCSKAVRGIFETELAAKFTGEWWRLGDPDADMELDYRAMKALGKSLKAVSPGSWTNYPCQASFTSPMDNILEVIHELSTRVSLIAAKEANIIQDVKFFGEKTSAYWLLSKQFRGVFPLSIIAVAVLFLDLVNIWWGCWKTKEHYEMLPETVVKLEAAEVDSGLPLDELENPNANGDQEDGRAGVEEITAEVKADENELVLVEAPAEEGQAEAGGDGSRMLVCDAQPKDEEWGRKYLVAVEMKKSRLNPSLAVSPTTSL